MQRTISRRAALVAALGLAVPARAGRAQAWPTRPLRILVPAVPGGATDIVTRAVAQPMGEQLGQSVVAENRAGGSGLIALDTVMASPPDGYTLLLVTEGNPMGPNMYKDWKPDPVRSLEYITLLGRGMFIVVVHPSSPADTLAELIEQARQSPQPMLYATPGVGQRLVFEQLKSLNKFRADNVAYKGGAQAVADLVSGHIKVGVLGLPPAIPHVRAGRLRALAVSGLQRSAALPDVPTVAELGFPGFEFTQWQGLGAPAGTPAEIIDRLHREALRAMALQATIDKLATIGMDNSTSAAPAAFTDFIRRETDRWPPLFKTAGIQPE
ncbi:Bug family tripartite tricarboxylate transporter substrate binding protein [Reyranella sp.]|uniref:Bug family tripartite tricarboxylate transporter substrate binding protein n=1 Tax=Reyranella sp. TaxID=1929291 RepID=UPI0037841794